MNQLFPELYILILNKKGRGIVVEENKVMSSILFEEMIGEIEFYYEWSPFWIKSTRIFINNKSGATIFFTNLEFKLPKENNIESISEAFIDTVYKLLPNKDFDKTIDLNNYNSDPLKKAIMHTFIEDLNKGTRGIPLFIKIDNVNFLTKEINLSDCKIFKKKYLR